MQIDLVSLEEVDSTSTYAQQLNQDGKQPPFAVAAASQTGGRGRRGRQWTSPRGNIYLSFVFSAPTEPVEFHGLIPLKVALLLQTFIAAEFGFRATVKWPNDILFAGQKLAGILCESSVQGDKIGNTCIGIGLNLNNAPSTAQNSESFSEYPSISMRNILGKRFDEKSITRSLVNHFQNQWQQIPLNAVMNQFNNSANLQNHLWVDNAEEFFMQTGVNLSGELCLRNNESETIINSVNHSFKWVYQGSNKKRYPLIVADIGNSFTKIALFENAEEDEPSFVESGDDEKLSSILATLCSQIEDFGFRWPIFMASVNAERSLELEQIMDQFPLQIIAIPKIGVRRNLQGYNLSDLGADRLANIEGWLASHEANQNPVTAVLVSCGTATTIDVVESSGKHLGGFILSGLQLNLSSLHQKTGLLPAINLSELEASPALEQYLGENTIDAMVKGSLCSQGEFIKSLEQKFDATALLTGGGAPILAALYKFKQDSNLILKGLKSQVLGGVYK